jgi:hypothetical protein
VYSTIKEPVVYHLKELRDLKEAASDYLASEDDDFRWGNTPDKEHQVCLGEMVTNDSAKALFIALTH